MRSKINKLLKEIEQKRSELYEEYLKLADKYSFSYIKWKVVFTKEAIIENRKKRKSIFNTLFTSEVREILSMPFIYTMFIPVMFLDIFLFIYQQTAIRLYGIPLTRRRDYITYDRKHLDYLNFIQKFNCLYCSYVNGFLSYAVEVAGRTEKYWCPIKSAKKMKWWHGWQPYFADYGDLYWYKEVVSSTKEYFDKEKNKEN